MVHLLHVHIRLKNKHELEKGVHKRSYQSALQDLSRSREWLCCKVRIILHSNCSFATNHHEVRSILIILQSFFAAGFGLVEDVAVALAASTKVARR